MDQELVIWYEDRKYYSIKWVQNNVSSFYMRSWLVNMNVEAMAVKL